MSLTSAKFRAEAGTVAPSTFSGITLNPKKINEIAYTSGLTTPNQADTVYAYSGSVVAASDVTIDLRGSAILQPDGTAAVFVHVDAYYIANTTASGSATLTVGGGSNSALAALKPLRPGDFHQYASVNGGFATTAATGDLLLLSSSSGTVTYDLIIVGRST